MIAPELEVAAVFRAISSPGRRAMAEVIGRSERIAFGELRTQLRLPQDLASKRLGALRRAQLVSCERKGKEVLCRLARPGWTCAYGWFAQVLVDLPDPEPSASLDRLFKLLQDAGRRRLLEALGAEGPAMVGRLAAAAMLTPDAASRKLSALRAAGCAATASSGPHTICRLAPSGLRAGWDWIDERHGQAQP